MQPPQSHADGAFAPPTIELRRKDDGWEIEVRLPDGSEYAKTWAKSLWSAMEATVPYVVHAAQPDPFESLLPGANG